MVVELRGPGGKALRNPTEEVTDIENQVLPYLSQALLEMDRLQGIGVAANQIRVPYRWFVDKSRRVFINPKILEASEKVSIVEGCLSLPERWFEVERYKKITVEYWDLDNNRVESEFKEIGAYIFQHEIDHLDGILVEDHGTRRYAGS